MNLQGLAVSLTIETLLSSDRLPSLPEVAVRVLEIARRPDPDFGELVEAIRLDPAIAGRVLKTANSALLGMRTRASSIESAVPRLGTTMVRALVLGFCLADSQQSRQLNLRPAYQRLWRESLRQAAAAELLGERQSGRVDHCNWFLAGLLQDIGRLSLLSVCQDEYVEQILEVQDGRSQVDLERSYFGFTHVDVSAALCRRWNMEDSMVQAIQSHHLPPQRVVPLCFESSTSLAAGLITSAHIADYLSEVGSDLTCSRQQFERLLLQVFAVRPNDVFRLLADIDSRVGELASAFSLDIGVQRSLESILSEAQAVLSQIAVNSQLRLVNAYPESGVQESRLASSSGSTADSSIDAAAAAKRWRDMELECFNRAWLDQSLEAVLRQSHIEQLPLGLLLVDTQSHPATNLTATAGERLQQWSQLLQQCVRLSDSVVHFEAGQFLLLLTDINLDMLHLLADQIRRRMRRITAGSPDGTLTQPIPVGAVFYQPGTTRPATAAALVKEVRNALQESARRGGQQNELIAVEDGRSRRVQCMVLHQVDEVDERVEPTLAS